MIEIDRVTHRRDAIYQALLPGKLEHRLLMGMPREPTIYAEVNKVAPLPATSTSLPAARRGSTRWCRSPSDRRTMGNKPSRRPSAGTARSSTSWVVDEDIESSTRTTSSGLSPRVSRRTAAWWC